MPKTLETAVGNMDKVYLLKPLFVTGEAISLREQLCLDLAAQKTRSRLIIDASQVTESDIVSVNALVQIHLMALEYGTFMGIKLHAAGPLDQWLQLTKFHQLLNLVYS